MKILKPCGLALVTPGPGLASENRASQVWGLTGIEKQSHLFLFLCVCRVTTMDCHVKFCAGGVDRGSEQVDRREGGRPSPHPAQRSPAGREKAVRGSRVGLAVSSLTSVLRRGLFPHPTVLSGRGGFSKARREYSAQCSVFEKRIYTQATLELFLFYYFCDRE